MKLIRRLIESFRNWQDPCWDYPPLRECPPVYRFHTYVVTPLLAIESLLVLMLLGVDMRVHDWTLVGVTVALTAVLSTVVFKMDDFTAADPVTALPIALLIAGETSGALIAIVVSMLASGVKVPMPRHISLGVNVLGCGIWQTATSAAFFWVAAGSASPGSATWFVAALATFALHSLLCTVSLQVPWVLMGARSVKEAVAGQLDMTRMEVSTLAAFTVLAGYIMAGGAWWTSLFAAAPMLMTWEAYRRTTQYVEARKDAEHDALTGLYNRRALELRLTALLADPGATPVWVMLCDLDNFKRLNDVHGHHIGDAALVKIGGVLRDCARDGNIICARLGGEEFVVVVRGVEEPFAKVIAGRVLDRGRDELAPLGSSLSIGLYRARKDDGIDVALQRADFAMYYSKQSGKDRVTEWHDDLKAFDRRQREPGSRDDDRGESRDGEAA